MIERSCIPLTCITPLALSHALMTAPYLSPAAAYTLLPERATTWKWDAPLAPLMKWLRASLYQTCPGVKSLPPLEMADHITVSLQTLQRQLVPRIPSGPATQEPTYIVHQAHRYPRQRPPRRKDLHNVGTCRPLHCTGSLTSRSQKNYQKSGIP